MTHVLYVRVWLPSESATRRPLAANVNGNNFITGVDVQGFSHESEERIESWHSDHKSVPTVLSECCSCTSHRLPVSARSPSSTCIREQNSPGTRREPFDRTPMGVDSISPAHLHVLRDAPPWSVRVDELAESRKIPTPKANCRAFS